MSKRRGFSNHFINVQRNGPIPKASSYLPQTVPITREAFNDRSRAEFFGFCGVQERVGSRKEGRRNTSLLNQETTMYTKLTTNREEVRTYFYDIGLSASAEGRSKDLCMR